MQEEFLELILVSLTEAAVDHSKKLEGQVSSLSDAANLPNPFVSTISTVLVYPLSVSMTSTTNMYGAN